jgi:HlyD family secretion protein
MRVGRRCLGLIAAAGLFLSACEPKAPEAGQPPALAGGAGKSGEAAKTAGARRAGAIPVATAMLKKGTLMSEHSTAGAIAPVTQSQVAAQVGGFVAALQRKAGDWVAAGATVVQLDETQLKLALQSARNSHENARINLAVSEETVQQSGPKLELQLKSTQSSLAAARKNFDAQKALYDLGGATGSQLDNARSQLEQAQANLEAARFALEQNQRAGSQNIAQFRLAVDQAGIQLEQARLNLANAAIKAPFTGQLALISVMPGMYVGQNTSAFLLVSAERQVVFSVPPANVASLPPDTAVNFSFQGRTYALRVGQAASAPIGGVVPMVAPVPASLNLPFGGVGTISYRLELAEGALVPMSAIQINEDKNFVFTVVNGRAAVQPITLLAESGTTAAAAGIEAGAQVIINPPPGLLAGSPVLSVSGLSAETPGQQPARKGGP